MYLVQWPSGSNRAFESFSIGRIIAFDPVKGRLWVVYPPCRNWNLVPLEERWEPVEEGERRFGEVSIETSSENIAAGRLANGTGLIRVGRVDPPELAAWRYAKRLARRYHWAPQL